jgi:phenylacetate-CoA ligase
MRFQQAIRPARAAVNRAFLEGMTFRELSARWTEDKKREWLIARLRSTVRRAARETVYYHQLFKRIGFDPSGDFSFKEFAHIPVLDRDDIHGAGKTLVTNAIPISQLKRNATGGSTGIPTEIWLGPEEEGWGDSAREYFMSHIGLREGTRLGMLWGHHLDPVASDRLLDRFSAFAHNAQWFDCFRLSPEKLEGYHETFQRFQPAAIVAYASALGHLAEHILDRGHTPRYPSSSLVTGAEKLMPAYREKVERAFGCPVHERYGSRDVGLIGFQLEPWRTLSYTIDWANVFVEPETDELNASILVTKLHADGMPMIRYRIGDEARFPNGSRSGYPCFQLPEVIGRATDRVWLPNGQWINGIQLPHLLKDYPVREFMFLQRADYSVHVKIIPKSTFTDHSLKIIEETISANLPGLEIRLDLVNDIPRTKANKWRPVLTEVCRSKEA